MTVGEMYCPIAGSAQLKLAFAPSKILAEGMQR